MEKSPQSKAQNLKSKIVDYLQAGRWSTQLTPQVAILLVAAGGAWVVTVLQARTMGAMSGTMGMSLISFVVMWTLMMAAMMLPSVTPLAVRYIRMIDSYRWLGLTSFTAGYLGVWAASGFIAFIFAWLFGQLTSRYPTVAVMAAIGTYAVCGIYQFSPLKHKCLAHCRAPFSLLLDYASWRGPLRHLRVGLHHGGYCLGCCWALMALMFAFGVMNIGAMIVLTVVIAVEKIWTTNETFSQAVGLVCFALAIAVIWFPRLAPGFISAPMPM